MTSDWNSDRVRHGADRRATVRLMYYWLSLRRIGNLPAFADFDPRRNPVRWEICFLLNLEPDGDARFDHVGREFDGRPLAGRLETHATAEPGNLLGLALGGLDCVRETALPYRRDGSVARGPRQALRYRTILLPFADLSGDLRYVLGAMSHCLADADPLRLAGERAGPITIRPEDGPLDAPRALAS